jgi:hypothetical protein
MSKYEKNYKGYKYSISNEFIVDMENNHQIDMIKEIEKILDDEIKLKRTKND